MKMKNVLLLILTLSMVFALCACSAQKAPENTEKNETAPSSTAAATEEPTTEADDGKVTYTVAVVDEGGNPVAGAMVQLCLEACIPGVTNAEGKATYNVEEADYKVSFVSMPAGYASDVNEFHFDDGKYELTITLKAVA